MEPEKVGCLPPIPDKSIFEHRASTKLWVQPTETQKQKPKGSSTAKNEKHCLLIP